MGSDLHSILLGFLTNIIWIPVGALLGYFGFIISVRLPGRRLWQIKDPSRLVVCAANSTVTRTDMYNRPATGIGQVRALALSLQSLYRAYNRNLEVQNILLSTDRLAERLDNDLLILGGPKNNAVAAKFLDLITEQQPVIQKDSSIYWREQQNRHGQWINNSATEFLGSAVKRKVVVDYGLIVRARSPFTSRHRTVILFSGSHTWGTVAAATYFVHNIRGQLRHLLKGGCHNFAVLVSAQIIDEHPTRIQIERYYAW